MKSNYVVLCKTDRAINILKKIHNVLHKCDDEKFDRDDEKLVKHIHSLRHNPAYSTAYKIMEITGPNSDKWTIRDTDDGEEIYVGEEPLPKITYVAPDEDLDFDVP